MKVFIVLSAFVLLAAASDDYDKKDDKHYAGYGRYVYQGRYPGKCGADGLYFRDEKCFVFCSNGNSYVQPCAPGSRNSAYGKYSYGGKYDYRDFCDVNLVDEGYAAKHGGYGYGNGYDNAFDRTVARNSPGSYFYAGLAIHGLLLVASLAGAIPKVAFTADIGDETLMIGPGLAATFAAVVIMVSGMYAAAKVPEGKVALRLAGTLHALADAVKLIWKEEGMAAMYGGLVPHMLRVVPSAAIMFGVYETVLKLLGTTSSM